MIEPSALLADGSSLSAVWAEMMETGMPASRSFFEEKVEECDQAMLRIGGRIRNDWNGGRAFNPRSGPQTNVLLRTLGLKPLKKSKKTKLPSTAKDSIGYLQYEHPAIKDLFEWREAAHLRDAFCRPLLSLMPKEWEDAADIHPIVGPLANTRVASRRLACKRPNLLNPSTEVRKGFICPTGELLAAQDYSQIEIRVLAHVSKEPNLIARLNAGMDMHTATAADVFKVELDAVTKKQRKAAKAVNFGGAYGQGAQGLREKMWEWGLTNWTLEMCQGAIDARATAYPGLKEYDRRVEYDLEKTGIVYDMWGMPRRLPGIWSTRKGERAAAVREAVNHTIQGGAQGMIQKAMVWLRAPIRKLQDRGAHVRWALQMHDELVFRCEAAAFPELETIVRTGMEQHSGVELAVPVLVDGGCGTRWADLK